LLTGGAASTGGALTGTAGKASGGTQALGGTRASGGASATNDSTTSISMGGTKTTGGTPSIGGAQSSGGTKSAGGTSSLASGTKSTGGTLSVGGTKSTTSNAQTGGTQATGGKSSASTARTKCSVYIAGDSTVSSYTLTSSPKDQAGWGQMLQQYYDSNYVTVLDKAVGGMTARHFIQAGNLQAILSALKPGDYFLVQFGTNDSNTTATYTIDGVSYPYFADANTDFKTYLQEYIDGANAKGATPVLVTPPPRNSAYCGGGRSMASYADAMLALGKADNVAVVDLSIKTWTYLNAICPKPTEGSTENFFKVNSDNTIDGTHFQESGAIKMAGFVADGIGEAGLALDANRLH
jgi:lysophospholipase L1-like esterase